MDIFVGSRTFSGRTVSSRNYEDEVKDISTLPGRGKKKGAPLAE